MRRHMTAVTALASCLTLAAAAAAYAAPSFNPNSGIGPSTSLVELAGQGGAVGGGGIAGSGGTFRGGVAASPRGQAFARGGGSLKGYGGGGGGKAFSGGGGGKPRGDYARKGGGYYARKGGGDYYARKGGGYYAHKGDRHDYDKHRYSKFYRYYTPGIFLYGAYSYYDECDWLRRKARITGSPYWWRRYQECVYLY